MGRDNSRYPAFPISDMLGDFERDEKSMSELRRFFEGEDKISWPRIVHAGLGKGGLGHGELALTHMYRNRLSLDSALHLFPDTCGHTERTRMHVQRLKERSGKVYCPELVDISKMIPRQDYSGRYDHLPLTIIDSLSQLPPPSPYHNYATEQWGKEIGIEFSSELGFRRNRYQGIVHGETWVAAKQMGITDTYLSVLNHDWRVQAPGSLSYGDFDWNGMFRSFDGLSGAVTFWGGRQNTVFTYEPSSQGKRKDYVGDESKPGKHSKGRTKKSKRKARKRR